MIAYHFESDKHVLDVIANQQIKLSLINDLNDPFELIAVDSSDFKSNTEPIKFRDYMAQTYGILCFSKNWKNPLLWSHYANRHKGAALEFYIKDEIALPVNYEKTRFELNFKEEFLEQHIAKGKTDGLWLTKFKSWIYEEEIRVICKQSDCIKSHSDLLFHPFNDDIFLKGIILGPLCELKIKDIKDKLPVGKELEVIKSRLAFRSFDIVEDESFKKQTLKKL